MEEQLRDLLLKRNRSVIHGNKLRHAAVLVPLFTIHRSHHILFIRRSQKVEHHKGEISFPGGICEKDDGGLEATALREAFEEIGLAPHHVNVLGKVDDMATVSTRHRVTPVVAVIPYPYSFRMGGDEVDEIITIPLLQLLAEGNGGEESIIRGGKAYTGCVYRYRDYVIWGATARIVKNVLTLWNAVIPLVDTSSSP